MKKIITLFILALPFFSNSQNLVPNGSFEDTVSCPTTIGQIQRALFWHNPTIDSPDYFNQCSAWAALGYFGYQQPHSGNAYAGIELGAPMLGYREYIETSLTNNLIAGSCYHFEMYANLAHVNFTSDNLQIYFSDTIILSYPTGNWLPFVPQIINTPGNILDTMNWTLISGEYEAIGGESYLIIGNFNDNSNSVFFQVDNTINYSVSYAYIDDVSLTPTVCTGIEDHNSSNEINIYPNPTNDFININSLYQAEFILYEILSKEVIRENFISSTKIKIDSLNKGMYLYSIRDSKNILKTSKIIIF